jgi:uncharacterized protein YlxP (DUF503 family)
MVVGVVRLELALPGNGCLKDKRRVVKSLVDRLRHRFNVSVAEVDHQNAHRRATVAVACVSGDRTVCGQVLEAVIRFVDASGALVQDCEVEFY